MGKQIKVKQGKPKAPLSKIAQFTRYGNAHLQLHMAAETLIYTCERNNKCFVICYMIIRDDSVSWVQNTIRSNTRGALILCSGGIPLLSDTYHFSSNIPLKTSHVCIFCLIWMMKKIELNEKIHQLQSVL